MTAQGRARAAWLALGGWLLTGLAQAAEAPPSPPRLSDALRGDAALHDVCFVTPACGWAVGDRGTIWHTDNGGYAWRLQESGVSCRLESVAFLDERHGWAAGGWTHPYTHLTSGVILETDDGGEHWNALARLMLPALKKLRFVNGKYGWAIGAPSSMYPSGVLVTENGGRSWDPLPGGQGGAWQAGDLLDPQTGAVAGPRAAVACLRRGGLDAAQMPPLGLRAVTRLRLIPPGYGMLVGQGGLVLLTPNAGATWQLPPSPLPDGLAGQFDLRALEVRGARCWLAGSPGSRVFFTPDAGRTWTVAATGQPLPLEGLAFADDQHGWAVGQLGTILATDDGGQTWKRQRGGGGRVALLGLLAQMDDVPLELLGELSGEEGYLSAVEVLGRGDLDTPATARQEPSDRLREAVLGVGACTAETAWNFPLRPAALRLSAEQIVAEWDQANGGRALQELEAHLVRQIRTWRPEVVVTNDLEPQDAAGRQVAQMVLRAVELATQPTAYPEQLPAGLEPWTVKRVYAILKSGAHGSIELSGAQVAARSGKTLLDLAALSHGLLASRGSDLPDSFGFHPLYDQLTRGTEGSDFFRGIALEPGGEARRRLAEPVAEAGASPQRVTQKQRNLRAVLERAQDPQLAQSLLAQVGQLLSELDAESGALLLFRLAQRYEASGLWPLAAEAYQLLAERYPEHPLTPSAQLWLLHYHSSGEVAWRLHGPLRHGTADSSTLPGKRLEQATALAQQIQRTYPQLYTVPEVGFALAAAQRQGGAARQAERFYLAQARGAEGGLWRDCARGEQWLADPKGPAPRPVFHCVAASSKPHLDGHLDDALWKQAERVELHGARPEENCPTSVQIAYDDQFLYLGIDCQEAAGARYEAASGPRSRDADLSDQDRVEILLDVDRDYASYYRLVIDYRGWTNEACWGDARWNPQWFVAAAAAEGHWTAEAALPLDQLGAEPPRLHSAWAIGLQRMIPGVGFESWNAPACAEGLPEGFGYLLFP